MKYVKNMSNNPYFNLALEEYVLKCMTDDEYFILWQNKPAIIVGKHQNTVEEINRDYVMENNIAVVRRLSGGGAVYHDLGNLNYTFIIKNEQDKLLDFKTFSLPVIKALEKFGVNAELSGRNDLTIDGRKFSGGAQYIHKNRLLHHGTLLFNSDLDVLQEALNVDTDKIQSKGIKSVRSRVTNISEYVKEKVTVQEFAELLKKYIFEFEGWEIKEHILTEQDMEKIRVMMDEKYARWEWNYGQSPPFNYKNSKRFSGGKVEVFLEIEEGMINGCKIYGDFLGVGNIVEIEESLKGVKYTADDLEAVIKNIDMHKYFGSISAEELISCFI